MSPGDFAAKTM